MGKVHSCIKWNNLDEKSDPLEVSERQLKLSKNVNTSKAVIVKRMWTEGMNLKTIRVRQNQG